MLYSVVYILREDLVNNKIDVDKIQTVQLTASDANRAINAVRSGLVDDGTIESKGDVKVLEAKLGL